MPDRGAWFVDASIILKWFLPAEVEPDVHLARSMVGQALKTSTLAFYEAGNTLSRAAGFQPEEVAASLEMVIDTCGNPVDLVPADFPVASRIAKENSITFYDASYVAIARRLGRNTLSADSDLLGPGLAVDLTTALSD